MLEDCELSSNLLSHIEKGSMPSADKLSKIATYLGFSSDYLLGVEEMRREGERNMRKKIIAGNWKMNKTPREAIELINEIKAEVAGASCDVVVCPTFVCLSASAEALKGTNIKLGAQNVHFEKSGAYTGEIAADMLEAIGVEYVIIGHSERRQYFGETDETVNKRTIAALAGSLIPIVCVGEVLGEREAGVTREVVCSQTKLAFRGISADDAKKVVIAYEPVWAIGTGKTATSAQADEVCKIIRDTIKELYGAETAEEIRIQYGGSMNAANAAELLAQPNIDGGLIGGASLKAADFGVIVRHA
ncbi:triosephosphate isomerase [Holotrichia oblita]|nr:triosephosphate isomerase [Holotrichia oblita]